MKILKSTLCLLIIIFTVCCSSSLGQQTPPNSDVPKGWKMEKAEGRYTMYLPPSAWDTGLVGIDEFYREWRIGRLRFVLIHEPMGILSYSSREKELGKGFRESIIEIGGRKAYLCDYSQKEKGRTRYYTDVFVGDWPNSKVKLWMRANSSRAVDLETAKKIFRTLQFLDN
jgi:hypothetical protein